MAIGTIGGVDSTSTATQLSRAGLDQQGFLKLLLAQLTYQDPLKPMDNKDFIAQMAQFTSLDQSRQTNDKIDTLLTIQSATQSLGLLNKTVEISVSGGTAVGTVTTISFNQGVPNMTVMKSDGQFLTGVTLSQIVLVR
jgi:flagellar basal-body rod modification protein FlgD